MLDFIQKITQKQILSLPTIIFLSITFAIPMLIIIVVAFCISGDYGGILPIISTKNQGLLSNNYFANIQINLTLDNLMFMLQNKFFWQLAIRSIHYSLITTVCCLFLAYPVALLIARVKHKYRDGLLLLIIVPFWSCFLIRIYAWMIILGPSSFVNHAINYLMHILGLQEINLLYSSFTVIVCLVYINLPFMILPLYSNLEKHKLALLDACRDLGATKLQTFLKITLPLSMSGILAGSVLVFIPSIGMFVIPELVGDKCSLMIGNLIKQEFLQTMNWSHGSMAAILMSAIILSITGLLSWLISKFTRFNYVLK